MKNITTTLLNFLSIFAMPDAFRESEMESHFFIFTYSDPILRPMFAEVEVWSHDAAQVAWTVDIATYAALTYLPTEQIARDALFEATGSKNFHRHCLGKEDFEAYLKLTGMRPDKWCTVRRGALDRWEKHEETRQ